MPLRIGDILRPYLHESQSVSQFTILQIRSFDRSLLEISYGYASELWVEGENGEILNSEKYLYF